MELQGNMKLQINELDNTIQRIIYACKSGDWYYANKVYFEQFLNLREGDFAIDEYLDEISRLQCLRKLKSENHDFDCFLRGLRPDILENMK